MRHVLFICSRNQLRSPTAEQVFSKWAGIEVASAGLDKSSREQVTPELLEWADLIFVMERAHRNKLAKKFRSYLKHQRVICLNIPDEYSYMEPRLVRHGASWTRRPGGGGCATPWSRAASRKVILVHAASSSISSYFAQICKWSIAAIEINVV